MQRIGVYCGSSPGHDPVYADMARRLGRSLAARGLGLVYGGADVGLMGAVADAALQTGARVIGVIPQAIAHKVSHPGLTELHVVDSMHARKALMFELADGFVALPGGYGTLEEVCELLTWAQLGLHTKPCGILNVKGYFDGLLAFLDHMVVEGFLRCEHRAMLLVDQAPEDLLDRFEEYAAPTVEKWALRECVSRPEAGRVVSED